MRIAIVALFAFSHSVASQRPATRDTAMARAVTSDKARLRQMQAPGEAQERAWKRADWTHPTSHRIAVVEANGQHLELVDWGGAGVPMLFLPGMGHTSHVFDEFAPRFTDAHHVLGLTLRGHGRSSAPRHPYTVDSLAADVHAAIETLGLRGVVLVGHSLGGHVANRVAAMYPTSVSRVVYLDATKDSTGLATLRAAAPTVRPDPSMLRRPPSPRAHWAERLLYFNFWSDAQEGDLRSARTAPEVPEMADLYALQDWRSVHQTQLGICALDTPDLQFPWLEGAERARLRDAIATYVAQRFVPWERAGCERFSREAPRGTLAVVAASNHYVFLVSAEQTYLTMRRWLANPPTQ